MKHQKPSIKYFLIVFTLLYSVIAYSYENFDYKFELVNEGNENITDVLIKSDNGIYLTFSKINSGKGAIYHGPFSVPPNVIFTIYWQNFEGIKYKSKVDLDPKLPRDYKGFIIFTIDNETLTTSAKM